METEEPPLATPPTLSPEAKITLFRSLFRGREDIFPKLWTDLKSGRKGYTPACSKEWAPKLCGKVRRPPIKCGNCDNRAFIPVSDKVIEDHLRGKQTIGAYPLLADETCCFLAVDFDKGSWQEDVAAFRETCRSLGIPVSVERSRSGNGGHAWFFFTEPVKAATARTMGCYLITETMSQRHQLSMESYDRLFPSQDIMPRGGFGNLIALPLQAESRKAGNSVFIDDEFVPYPDQWAYLASLQRLAPQEVQAITDKAVRQGKVVGLCLPSDDEEEHAPWELPPSGRLPVQRIRGKLLGQVMVVIAQRIFVEKKGLPSALINRIKRLAAFQNPEFFKKQKMRLSTALTPRVIACFEDLPEHVALPRGCFDALLELLNEHDIRLSIVDKLQNGAPCTHTFHGVLTEVQKLAVNVLLKHDIGIFVAPPGSGKTVVGAYLAANRHCSTLVLVHRKPLLNQWVAQLSRFLDLPKKAIGTIGSGKSKPTGVLDVAMIQSLVRKHEVSDLIAGYGQVIVDECHHLPAVSFERVLSEVKARYIVGLTATPYRRDGHQSIIHLQCGPTRFSLHRKQHSQDETFVRRLIMQETGFTLPITDSGITIQELYAKLSTDRQRNRIILDDIRRALADGRSPILLTERKDHLEFFAENLRKTVRHMVVLHGGMAAKKLRTVMDQLSAIPDDEERLILATGRYIGEGFDDARLDTLFLALPFSWKGMLVQYTGRLHRQHPGKEEVRVYDYMDNSVPMLVKMHDKRMRGFRAMGYAQVQE
ncbi:MAG: DEAD/DEAH box helicase family protein [Geobacteraceae bacterium]